MTPEETRIHAASAEESSSSTPNKSSPSNVVDESPHQRQSSALASFLTLPFELQQRIVTLACGPPTIDRWTLAGRSTSCTTTMLRLLYAGKVFYPLVSPLLYRHVRLTRPSTLHAFARTLCDKPALGQLLESLHLGEDEELPLDWWPILAEGRYGSNPKTLRLDLASGEDQPWRDSASVELDIHGFDKDVVRADALRQAFKSAREYLNVSMEEPRYEGPPRRDYRSEWCINVFKLKASMELYYLELRRLEKPTKDGTGVGQERVSKRQKTQHADHAPSYPRLCISSAASAGTSSAEDGGDFFHIDHTQLLERLRIPGSPTDGFNHPYLFACSSMYWIADGPNRGFHFGDQRHKSTASYGRLRAATATSSDGCAAAPPRDQWGPIDPATLQPATTVVEIIGLAHRVLTLASQVRSLSVTGIFELVVAGEQPAPLVNLYSLSIGPRPTEWGLLHLSHPDLSSVSKLRVCCNHISDELEAVLGKGKALQGLSQVQWSMMLDHSRERVAR